MVITHNSPCGLSEEVKKYAKITSFERRGYLTDIAVMKDETVFEKGYHIKNNGNKSGCNIQ